MRTRFDSIALGVISYLESLPEVCGTNFCYGSGVSSQGTRWQCIVIFFGWITVAFRFQCVSKAT